MSARQRDLLLLALITLAGLALRLLVWHWRAFQPLGGDEQEYLNQALTLLRERSYVELRLMRPPLYTLFLASSIVLVDSLVQNLRLVQASLSAATVPLVYLLTLELTQHPPQAGAPRRGVALLAAGLCAASYTLAANATELLTETLFLFGLSAAFWLLLHAARLQRWPLAALAGLTVGALSLVRSVGLPLVPLAALWLGLAGWLAPAPVSPVPPRPNRLRLHLALVYACCALLVILPWTARNYLRYGGLILIDTTGAENLWLDNDPAGREAVKAQLYALGEERLLRQQIATQRGSERILADPARFAAKAWDELLAFFALEQSDDMLTRRAIWVSPGETWTRLLLGDALWLLIMLGGSYGLTSALAGMDRAGGRFGRLAALRSPAWLLAPWALYVLLTTLIFHVELRYRLPLYPALLPYAALSLAELATLRGRGRLSILALAVPLIGLGLTLLHAPYPALALQLGPKHWQLARAEAALAQGELELAYQASSAALAHDERSALARIGLARVAAAEGNLEAALALLDAALVAVPDHAQAHVLRGDLHRLLGDAEAARTDLAYERATRQDLQAWLWARALTPAASRLELGNGLDLGFVRGVHAGLTGERGYRWTAERAHVRLQRPAAATRLHLQLASGRPAETALLPVEIWLAGTHLTTLAVPPTWHTFSLDLPASSIEGELVIELRTPGFTPRDYDPASPDGRRLGLKLASAELR